MFVTQPTEPGSCLSSPAFFRQRNGNPFPKPASAKPGFADSPFHYGRCALLAFSSLFACRSARRRPSRALPKKERGEERKGEQPVWRSVAERGTKGFKLLEICSEVDARSVRSVLLPDVKRGRNGLEKLQSALQIFAKEGKLEHILELLEACQEDGTIELDPLNYTLGMVVSSRLKSWPSALVLLEAMPKARIQQNLHSYNAALSACEKSQQWEAALSVLAAMPMALLKPDIMSWSAAICACATRWKESEMLLEAMREDKVRPVPDTFAAATIACTQLGQWEDAIMLLETMPKTKVLPTLKNYIATSRIMATCSQWQEALMMVMSLPEKKISPSSQSYVTAMRHCTMGSNWQLALTLFEEMPQVKISQGRLSYESAIQACSKGGPWQQSVLFLAEMFHLKLLPSFVGYNHFFDHPDIGNSAVGAQLFLECPLQEFVELRQSERKKRDLHGLQEGAAQLVLRYWLSTTMVKHLNELKRAKCSVAWISTGYGIHRPIHSTTDLRQATFDVLRSFGLKASIAPNEAGLLKAELRKTDIPALLSMGAIFETTGKDK